MTDFIPFALVVFIVVFVATAIALISVLAMTGNLKFRDSEKDDHAAKRRLDIKLTSDEKQVFEKAKQYIESGDIKQGAELLRSIHLERLAISILEQSGFLEEATDILKELGAFDRAAVFYGAHGKWESAIDCFVKADKPFEAAMCARAAESHQIAAFNFDRAGHPEDAAQCYVKVGNHLRAGRLYLACGEPAKAVSCFEHIVSQGLQDLLDEQEIEILQTHISRHDQTTILRQAIEGTAHKAAG